MARSRRRVVDNMSDNIEEDDATQHREVDAVDADEDEDQQNRQSRSTLGRSAQGGSATKRAAAAQNGVANERDDDAEDATPVFDADSFGNKPLSRPDGQKLQGMASDWNMIETRLKESAFSLLTEVSTAVAEYADDSTARKVTTLRPHAPFHAHSSCQGTGEAGRSHERDH
jgi:E3 SUMO-protein ligase NSE2